MVMKLAYTNIRVGDLERSLQFYQEIIGMKLHRRIENPDYRYSLAWLGFSEFLTDVAAGVELTYNWDQSLYELGNGFGQLVISVDDVYTACEMIKAKGWSLTREAGPVKGGTSVIAFLEDPDGYRIEFIETMTADREF